MISPLKWEQDIAASCIAYLHSVSGSKNVNVTPEMRATVAGIFSGRIKIEGMKIAVGASVQDICPIDVVAEEKRTGKEIFLA